ncbi:hypothetical protein Trydic_g13184 [Trypoxylus dichotomus]
MLRGKSVGAVKLSNIITLHKEDFASRQIGEKLDLAVVIVGLEDRDRRGALQITTSADDRLVLSCRRNRRRTTPEIASEFNRGRQRPVSVATVKNQLAKGNLNGHVATRKPLLRLDNRLKGLQWAREHRDWTVKQ